MYIVALCTRLYAMRLPVIVLDDITHRPDRREVLVNTLRTNVMQRLRRPGVPVGACEVDSHLHAEIITLTSHSGTQLHQSCH